VFLGPADYVSHEGGRPMAITWRLRQPMPTEVYQASTVAMAWPRWWVEDEGGKSLNSTTLSHHRPSR
jgi:hypothetical protein